MIGTHHEEAGLYLDEFRERMEAGQSNPVDRANAALNRASQAGDVLSETISQDQLYPAVERVRKLAALTALAMSQDRESEAGALARAAEVAASEVDSFDKARFEGLNRPIALEPEKSGNQVTGRRS